MSKLTIYRWHELTCGCRHWTENGSMPGDPQDCDSHGEQTIKRMHAQNWKGVKGLVWQD